MNSEAAPLPLDKKRVLKARAEALARELEETGTVSGALEVIEFVLAGERYAVEACRVREVYPLRELVPLPCTPPFLLGIVNHRGQILSVIDFRRLFDLPLAGLTDMNKVILIESAGTRVGILADAIAGIRSISPNELQRVLPTLTGVRAEFLRGITPDGVAVLDAASILSDKKIVVHEEVSE